MRARTGLIAMLGLVGATLCAGAATDGVGLVFRPGGLTPPAVEAVGDVTVELGREGVLFRITARRAAVYRLRVFAADGNLLHDSGPVEDPVLEWRPSDSAATALEAPRFLYEVSAWDGDGALVGAQEGMIDLEGDDASGPTVSALAFDVAGNFTVGGYLGVGIASPQRAVHIRGSNAVFRMDRSANTAAFMLVRTDAAGGVLKCFVVGVNAYGADDGTFVINDLGTTTGGSGSNRLTIDTEGNATFAKDVHAAAFVTASSRSLKTDIRPIAGALDTVQCLEGVHFAWKDSGEPSIGFIAEDVATVVPEVVAFDAADGTPTGVDYGKMTALLVEAVKAQQGELDALAAEYGDLEARVEAELRRVGDAGARKATR